MRGAAAIAPLLVLGACAVLAGGCGGGAGNAAPSTATAAAAFRGTLLTPPLRATDFALRDQAGDRVRLSAERGRYVILTFLYTHCPDVCPLIADQLNEALRRLGVRRAGVRVLAVSVDPRRDTPVAVRRFVAAHRLLPQFRYLTGTRAQLAPIWRAYHVAAMPSGSAINHSAFELLVDRRGSGRVLYDSRVKAADVLHDLRLLGATAR
jgi:protein SCO1/2